jgi:Tripartite tricarboxylate transporter TctB family
MKIGHSKDFWGGTLFAVIGLLFALIGRGVPGATFMPGYSMGTPARMGPGFFPFYLGVILFVLGLVIAIGGIRGKPGPESQVEKFHWGPILYVLGSVVMFGVLLKPIGMLIAGLLLVIGASLGSHEFKLKPVLILGVVLTIFCAFVFVGGLKLPIPLCPDIESLQSAVGFCRS